MILLVAFLVLTSASKLKCKTVHDDHHYYGFLDIPSLEGIRMSDVQKSKIIITDTILNVNISLTDPKAELCMHSWNKLFGSTRCFAMVHSDSDRFVWRRPEKCLKRINGVYQGIDPNCPDINKVEIAAYTYDQGRLPFQNSDLLKIFHTLVDVDSEYIYKIEYQANMTSFTLMNNKEEVLETTSIKHTSCSLYKYGFLLSWYFGGQCPAPVDVTACYEKLK